MPTPKKPRKDHEPCLCGCGRLSRGRSKYYEDACRSKFWRGTHLDGYKEFLKRRKERTITRTERYESYRKRFAEWVGKPENRRLIVAQKRAITILNKTESAWLVLLMIRADGVEIPNI